MTYEIRRQISIGIDLEAFEAELAKLAYRSAPHFLGNFRAAMYGDVYGRKVAIPSRLQPYFDKFAALVPNQKFNVLFVQKYPTGASVKPHKDPKNNTGKTIVFVCGGFTGATTTVENKTFQLVRGDCLIQDCSINGKQGPRHQVSEVLSGTRYAFILNTIN